MNGDTGRWQVNDPLYGVKKFIWVLRLSDWKEVFRWLRLPNYIRRFAYFFRELPKKISGAGWFFDQSKVLLMTDACVLFHAGVQKLTLRAFLCEASNIRACSNVSNNIHRC